MTIKKELREYKMRVGHSEIINTVYDESSHYACVKVPFLNEDANRIIKKMLSKVHIGEVLYTDYVEKQETTCTINYMAKGRILFFPFMMAISMGIELLNGFKEGIDSIKESVENRARITRMEFKEESIER